MKDNLSYIDENYKRIYDEIAVTADKYANGVMPQIMAVTKTVPAEAVNRAAALGIELIGENRVQEYLSKREEYSPTLRRHFIGRLQSNKAKYIVGDMELIESVDSLSLAAEIDRLAAKKGIVQHILAEVNIGGESSKGGVPPQELEEFLFALSAYKNLSVDGLMTIPPPGNEKYLYNMRCLFLDISSKSMDNINMRILSMGMSADYAAAIKNGSTLVRIGSALFGARA